MDEKRLERRKQATLARRHIFTETVQPETFITSLSEEARENFFASEKKRIETNLKKRTALPAGDYYSVRVTIGSAAGRNWWCVLFPPLCVGAASERESVMASAGLTRDQIGVMTDSGDGKYVLKFRVVEFLRRVFCSN